MNSSGMAEESVVGFKADSPDCFQEKNCGNPGWHKPVCSLFHLVIHQTARNLQHRKFSCNFYSKIT